MESDTSGTYYNGLPTANALFDLDDHKNNHGNSAPSDQIRDPLRDLLQEVLKNNSLAPDYDTGKNLCFGEMADSSTLLFTIDMMQRLNSISYLMQQKQDDFTLPVTQPNEICALQTWLEQLSANIQTNNCMYPDALASPPHRQHASSSSTATIPSSQYSPEHEDDALDYSSLAALMNSTPSPEFDTSSGSDNSDQPLYPSYSTFTLDKNLSVAPPQIRRQGNLSTNAASWSLSVASDQLLYPSSSPVNTPPASSSISSPRSSASSPGQYLTVDQQQQQQHIKLPSLGQPQIPDTRQPKPYHHQPATINNNSNMDSRGIIPSFWKPGPTPIPTATVKIPSIDGPAPYEEVDFTPDYLQQQQQQQPNSSFETSRTDVEPIAVAHNKLNTSHEIKKEMMHMINVFSSPATQDEDHTKNSDATSTTSSKEKDVAAISTTSDSDTEQKDQVATEDGGNNDKDSTDHRDASGEFGITTAKRLDNTIRPKTNMHATLLDKSNEDDKKVNIEDEDHASPYADLVGLLRNISLKNEESDTKLRERHAQLVDLLWNAALRSCTTIAPPKSTSDRPPLVQLKTPSTTIYPNTHIPPSSPSLKHSLASSPSTLNSHSITV